MLQGTSLLVSMKLLVGWEDGYHEGLVSSINYLFACSSSFRSCSTCGHRGPDPSGTAPSRPFPQLTLLLCLLMGMSSKYLGGSGAVEVGLGRGSTVLSPESISCSCRTCSEVMLPGHPSWYLSINPQTWVGILIHVNMVAYQLVEVQWGMPRVLES